MRRVKDDEKVLEPMFPRLHVNDSDKSGPRAPPRNKMALYEQLSIPSQRFTNHLPPEHSTQACARETVLYVQHQQQVSSSARVHAAEEFVTQRSCMENAGSFSRYNQRKTVGEEDDFSVPVFVNSRRVQSHGTNKKTTSSLAPSSRRSSEIQEVDPEGLKQNGSFSALVREKVKENTKQGGFLNSLYKSAREEMNVDNLESDYYRENRRDASMRQESRTRFDGDGETCGKNTTDNGVESPENNSGGGHASPDEVDNSGEYGRNREQFSQQQINEEASDGVSENSMVDSMSSANVSPDDMVEIIGQKRFWRARKAINNQQRLFAVQLFELHRLIKVQRLIAASPDLLLDDVTFLERGSAKSSPLKKLLPSEYIVKPLPRVAKQRDDSEKTNNHHKMECSAENAFGRTHVSSVNPPASPTASNVPHKSPAVDNGGGGWSFPPQPIPGNHQWLIPVMSPSEGLIYKPYPGPGHTGPACGGYYGHFNFMGGPTYGVPNPAFHPGVGFPSYFPPYGIPNSPWQQPPTEQTVNQFGHPGNLHNAAMNIQQQQSSCNFPPHSNRAASAPQLPVLGSYVQPPTEKTMNQYGHSGDAAMSTQQQQSSCNFSPYSNRAAAAPQPHPPLEKRQPRTRESSNGSEPQVVTKTTTVETRVIRVVPHNARLASENAARIFQSIQEERKHYEPY